MLESRDGPLVRKETMNRLDLRHILCPVDFSPLSTAALTMAAAIARTRDSELRALHVSAAEGPGVTRGLGSREQQRLMSQLREALTDADPTYQRIGAAARHGDPATEILGFARRMPADLIVMGTPGADRPERPMGPVAAVVVSRSECPVLTVPAKHTNTRRKETGLFGRIVCAVDQAPSSAGVIDQALSLAWESGGRLTYVSVLPEGSSASIADARRRLLAAIPSEAREWSQTDVRVMKGVASKIIVKVADETNADLVVIGAPRRWTSTTHAVLSRSLCPVLVTHDGRPLPRPVPGTAHERARASVARR
jgi:nucleotide-binding universal stress UspA family protein